MSTDDLKVAMRTMWEVRVLHALYISRLVSGRAVRGMY
jgi:hypothetical protein